MKHVSLSLVALLGLLSGCDFSPSLGDRYPPCVDGACARAGCTCMGGKVCVPDDPALGPEACLTLCESEADCDDQDPCTLDSCEEAVGCQHEPLTGEPCDDGNPCTPEDTCQGGACQGTGLLDCDDQDECTTDFCDPTAGCDHEPVTGLPPEDSFGDGACANGRDDDCDGSTDLADTDCIVCANDTDCEDGLPCTRDQCIAGDCQTSFFGTATPCENPAPCLVGGHCSQGQCVEGETLDFDGDAHPGIDCGGDDCDDTDATVFPGEDHEVGAPGSPLCQDGVDNDCDELTDEADPGCGSVHPVAGLCTAGGWCWENPRPQGNDLLGLWGDGATSWAVGPNGIVVRFEGLTPSYELLPLGATFADLQAIHGAGAEALAVGVGAILRHDADGWGAVDTSAGDQFCEESVDVWVVASDLAYVACRGAQLMEWNGAQWTLLTFGQDVDFLAVAAQEEQVWVADSSGIVWQRNGGMFQPENLGVDAVFHDLAVFQDLMSSVVLAVGDRGAIMRLDERGWTEDQSAVEGSGVLRSVWALSPERAVAAGDQVLAELGEGAWQWDPRGANGVWRGVRLLDEAAALHFLAVGLAGAVLGADGEDNLLMTARVTGSDLRGVWCGAGEVWAAGSGGEILLVGPYPGADSWTEVGSAAAALHGIWSDGQGRAWAVGDGGTLVRYEVAAQTLVPEDHDGGPLPLRAVAGIGDTAGGLPELWIVGDGGLVMHRTRESGWTVMPKVTLEHLRGLSAHESGVWAVGDRGASLRCGQGQNTCAPMGVVLDNQGTAANLLAILARGNASAYAVDDRGNLYEYSATLEWQWLGQVADRALRSLALRTGSEGDQELWIVGDRGLVLSAPLGDSLELAQVQIGANVDLLGVCKATGPDDDGLRVVGQGGAILRQMF